MSASVAIGQIPTMGGRGVVDRIAKWLAVVAGALSASMGPMPNALTEQLHVATALVVVDTITGLWVAFVTRQARSRTMIEKLLTKTMQYTILVCLTVAAGYMGHTWVPVRAALGIVIAVEALSLIENLYKLEKAGGVKMKPMRGLIQMLGKYFEQPTGEAKADER